MRPMAFSMPPFCQGLWGSQKKVWMPRSVEAVVSANSVPLSKVMVWRSSGGKGLKQGEELLGDGFGFFAGRSAMKDSADWALVNGEDGLAIFGRA